VAVNPPVHGPCSGAHQRATFSNVVGGEGCRKGLGGRLQEGIFGMQFLPLSFSSFFFCINAKTTTQIIASLPPNHTTLLAIPNVCRD
jgi:hypothetical protein